MVDAALIATQNLANLNQFNLMRNNKAKQTVVTRRRGRKPGQAVKKDKENVSPRHAVRPRGRPRRRIISSEPSEAASCFSDSESSMEDLTNK